MLKIRVHLRLKIDSKSNPHLSWSHCSGSDEKRVAVNELGAEAEDGLVQHVVKLN
jgi:hypothetical protein